MLSKLNKFRISKSELKCIRGEGDGHWTTIIEDDGEQTCATTSISADGVVIASETVCWGSGSTHPNF